ncbi:MAG: precorrin-8X methylmutase [Synergistaceae bacterium]|nr:precorrin-8X methylmutase [Synergistaceae bacterium]
MILSPQEIERESMRIIHDAIGEYSGSAENLPVIMRVIHATADFDFSRTLHFSDGAVIKARTALNSGTPIITDTLMLAAGITKRFGTKIICRISDSETLEQAKTRGITRAVINIERCVSEYPEAIYALGNAPTGLIRLCELIREGKANPALVVGVPVGFVNVIEAKNMLASLTNTPRIIAYGNKGGTTAACAIINAILYGLTPPDV